MPKSSDAYDGKCPHCGEVFTLADLKRMALGDGWQRNLWVEMPDGVHKLVSFDAFNPAMMKPIDRPNPFFLLSTSGTLSPPA